MTPPANVRVRYADTALVALVVLAARGVDGVVRLQRRPVAALLGRLGARAGDDASAIDLGRAADGTLDVSVRLVSRLHPTPVDVIAAVVDAVRAQLSVVGESGAKVEVTVTDVRR